MKTIDPPSNQEAEQHIISAILANPNCQRSRELLDTISIDDFYSSINGRVFQTIINISEDKEDINLLTIEDRYVKKYGEQDMIFAYLATLQKNFVSVGVVDGSYKLVKKAKASRDLLLIGNSISEMCLQGTEPREVYSYADHKIREMTLTQSSKDVQHIKEVTGNWLDLLEEREKLGGAISGLSTGFDQIDERLNGIGKECLVVVAGRPSMGKTLFTQSITQNVGIDQKKGVLFFSMEMSKEELYERFISGLSNVPAASLKRAKFSKEELGRVYNAVNEIDSSEITFTEEPTQSLGQIKAKARRAKNQNPNLSMIVIDYLGLMELDKADRHDLSIAKITRGLKQLAKEIKTPVFLIAQANRDLDKAKRPSMSNIKDSSAIEADADIIMFVHRQEVIEPETELKGLTEIIIAKDRHNDGNGTVYLEKRNGKFTELTTEQAAFMYQKEEQRLAPQQKRKGM